MDQRRSDGSGAPQLKLESAMNCGLSVDAPTIL
jgi:hypothetical protein